MLVNNGDGELLFGDGPSGSCMVPFGMECVPGKRDFFDRSFWVSELVSKESKGRLKIRACHMFLVLRILLPGLFQIVLYTGGAFDEKGKKNSQASSQKGVLESMKIILLWESTFQFIKDISLIALHSWTKELAFTNYNIEHKVISEKYESVLR